MQVLFEGFEAGRIEVGCEDAATIFHAFGNGCGFATGGAAHVEDGFAGVGIEQGDNGCGTWTLDGEEAFFIGVGLKEVFNVGYREQIGVNGFCIDAIDGELLTQGIGCCFEGIGANGKGGLGVVGVA